MNNLKKIEESPIAKKNPEILEDEDLKLATKSLDRAQSLRNVGNTEGGKVLIETLNEKVMNGFNNLLNNYLDYSKDDFVGICANIKANFEILKDIKKSEKQAVILQQEIMEYLETYGNE